MPTKYLVPVVLVFGGVLGWLAASGQFSRATATPPASGDTNVLPRPEEPFKGKIGRTVKDSTPDFPKGIEAPKGAPNVLLIMTDDVGFGASSTLAGRFRRRIFSGSPIVGCVTTCSTRPRFARRRVLR